MDVITTRSDTHTLPAHQHKHGTQIRLYSNVRLLHVHVYNLTSVVSSLVSLQMEAFTAQYAFIDYLGSSVERLTADLCEY